MGGTFTNTREHKEHKSKGTSTIGNHINMSWTLVKVCITMISQTLSRYGNNDTNNHNHTLMPMPTRAGCNGEIYHYNPSDPSFLSKFSIGFRGCLKYGNHDH